MIFDLRSAALRILLCCFYDVFLSNFYELVHETFKKFTQHRCLKVTYLFRALSYNSAESWDRVCEVILVCLSTLTSQSLSFLLRKRFHSYLVNSWSGCIEIMKYVNSRFEIEQVTRVFGEFLNVF